MPLPFSYFNFCNAATCSFNTHCVVTWGARMVCSTHADMTSRSTVALPALVNPSGCADRAVLLPFLQAQVLALGPEARQHYIQYCRHHMFAAHPTVPTLEDIQRILLGWYDATTARPVDATSAPADGAAASTEDAAQYHYQQQGYGRTSDPTQIPHGEASGAGVADYTMTGFWGITSIHRLEPQLAAVVLVLAACSRCSSGVLLDCVRTLEKQMVAVEGGVKILQRMADIS